MSSLPYGPELAVVVQRLRYSTIVDICTFTVLIYDYLITFNKEKDLIWPMSFKSVPKIIFLLTRYLPFVDMTFCMLQYFARHLTPEFCKWTAISIGWLLSTGLMFSEVLLTIRTWAIWERSRAMSIALSIWFIAIWVPALVIAGIFLDSLVYTTLPHPANGCLAITGNPIDFVNWVLLMVYEAGILTLIIVKAVRNFRTHGRSSVYRAVYRDGSLLYAYLFVLSTLNIIFILTFPDGMKQILSSVERVLHSILTERVIFALRELASKSESLSDFPTERTSYMELDGFDARNRSVSNRAAGKMVVPRARVASP